MTEDKQTPSIVLAQPVEAARIAFRDRGTFIITSTEPGDFIQPVRR